MKIARILEVADLIPQGTEAVSVVFRLTEEEQEIFRFHPGQYLTVCAEIAGSTHWRCYSITSRPGEPWHIAVLVRRVVGGRVSNWVCDTLRVGSRLSVLPPAGQFTLRANDRPVLLYAGGSGIAPLYALARHALEKGTRRVALFYANRDRQTTMLRSEIDALREVAGPRLEIHDWLDAEHGYPGPAQITAHAQRITDADAYLCGPDPFMKAVHAGLVDAGIPPDRIYSEDFGAAVADSDSAADDGTERTISVTLAGVRHSISATGGETLLSALLNAGLHVPHACKVGECASCICRLEAGRVDMMANSVLDDDDLADGLILACRSRPTSDTVCIRFS